MTHNRPTRVPFTAISNDYLDTIKPHLTHTESNVCDVVLRLTVGWHKESARISNHTFVSKSSKSERAIITAKKQLLDMGLLVQLEPARGTRPALYKLDLEYKTTKRDIKEPQHELQHTLPLLYEEDDKEVAVDTTQNDNNEPAATYIHNVINQNIQLPDYEPTRYTNISEDINCTQDNTQANEIVASEYKVVEDTVENIDMPSTTSKSAVKNHNSRGEANHVLATNYEEADTHASTEEYAPLPYSIISTSLNINRKQTMTREGTKQGNDGRTKSPVGVVCYSFTNLFPETKGRSTWKFIGWCVKNYGQEACLEQLDYIREYRKLHKVDNPQGLFRMALARDYNPPRYIAGMVKARRKADAAIQHGQKLMAERNEWKEESTDWGAGQAALSNMIAMLGQREREDG